MKTTEISPEKLRKKAARKEKEIAKWEREKARPKRNMYFAYLVFIITLIYSVDEIASQIGMFMKTEIANDLFAKFGQSSAGILEITQILVVPFQIIGLMYRPLADKWGRKKFLIINTFGMSFAMLVIFLSENLLLYFVGICMIQFFIPHDMHVVYIMESSPSKHRARVYSVVKFVANMGVMLIPLMRDYYMTEASQWRSVYMIPAVIGLGASLFALLSARETDAFIDARLSYLRMTDEEIAAEKEKKSVEKAQGGLIAALKFGVKHKQLRWLFITAAFLNLGFMASTNYQVIMSYGFAEHLGGFTQAILDRVSVEFITPALFSFSIGSAFAQAIMGFVSDGKGRKTAAMVTATNCVIGFIGFWLGAKSGWNPYIVGLFCGACIGSYYATNDVIIMMIGESAPTNLRSSCMSAQFIVVAAGVVMSYAVCLIPSIILGNQYMGILGLATLVPGFIIGLILLKRKTAETKGIDMDTVTGLEWD